MKVTEVDAPNFLKQKKENKHIKIYNIVLIILCIIIALTTAFTVYRFRIMSTKLDKVEQQLYVQQLTDKEVLDGLKEIKNRQEKIVKMQNETIAKRNNSVNNLQQVGFTKYTNLGDNKDLTAQDMDKIINIWSQRIDRGSVFKDKGYVFIEAAKETGLNPIYILAHAAVESNWGNSYIARTKHNYFGINCVDESPGNGYAMGDSVDEGIIAGAKWVAANFYNKGYTSLEDMKKANYATDPRWANNIASIANESIKLL